MLKQIPLWLRIMVTTVICWAWFANMSMALEPYYANVPWKASPETVRKYHANVDLQEVVTAKGLVLFFEKENDKEKCDWYFYFVKNGQNLELYCVSMSVLIKGLSLAKHETVSKDFVGALKPVLWVLDSYKYDFDDSIDLLQTEKSSRHMFLAGQTGLDFTFIWSKRVDEAKGSLSSFILDFFDAGSPEFTEKRAFFETFPTERME